MARWRVDGENMPFLKGNRSEAEVPSSSGKSREADIRN